MTVLFAAALAVIARGAYEMHRERARWVRQPRYWTWSD